VSRRIYNSFMNKTVITLSLLTFLFCCCSKMPVYPQASFDGIVVKIPLIELWEKKPAFYTFHTEKNSINYFVVKVGGSYQSYFDACGKCYRKKSGYRPVGDRIVCRACDVNYSVYDLKEGIGSCYPIKLEGRVEGDVYVIDGKAILEGKKYF
jgi:uncharacterized membrane protein